MALGVGYTFSEGLFFSPDRRPHWEPGQYGFRGEKFMVEGPGKSELHGLFVPAKLAEGTPLRGTVLYSHDCVSNFSHHLADAIWLASSGFNVAYYDPEGCGESTGELTLNGMVDDLEAVYSYLLSDGRADAGKLVLYGNGVGGEAVLRLLVRHPEGAAAAVVESVWATHRGWILHTYLPIISQIAASFLPKDLTEEPIDALGKVRIPLALLIPGRDALVPRSEAKRMREAAPKQAEIWEAEGERHRMPLSRPGEWRRRFLAFAKKAVEPAS